MSLRAMNIQKFSGYIIVKAIFDKTEKGRLEKLPGTRGYPSWALENSFSVSVTNVTCSKIDLTY